jgi:hypothetical protein
MQADELREEGRGLGRLVAGLGRRAPTTPIPMAVRERIVAFTVRATAAGWRLPMVARAVGVSVGSLRNWRREPARPPRALVPIVVTAPAPPASALTVVVPGGYRVEGLDVATAAALLRRLA